MRCCENHMFNALCVYFCYSLCRRRTQTSFGLEKAAAWGNESVKELTWPCTLVFVLQLINQKMRMCTQLDECRSFASVLQYLLAIGNYLNENAGKEKAMGFRLSSLTKVWFHLASDLSSSLVSWLMSELIDTHGRAAARPSGLRWLLRFIRVGHRNPLWRRCHLDWQGKWSLTDTVAESWNYIICVRGWRGIWDERMSTFKLNLQD